MPAAAADDGSKASLASTSAQTSPRAVARASAKSNTLVLPEEAVPQISVRQPRGRPPVSKSSCGMPLDAISGAGRTSRREAGTTAASLGIAPTWAKISAVFFVFAVFFAVERGEDGGEKIKGRPVAAAEKTGEADILLSHNCQGTRWAGSARARQQFSLFIRLCKYPPLGANCQDGSSRIIHQNIYRNTVPNCNLKIYNTLRGTFHCAKVAAAPPRFEAARPWTLGLAKATFVIIGIRRHSQGRYRLVVRTEDSQSSNPGSIPGSATNLP